MNIKSISEYISRNAADKNADLEIPVTYHGDIVAAGARNGFTVEILSSSTAVITISQAALPSITEIPEIDSAEIPYETYFQEYNEFDYTGFTAVRKKYGFTGKGVCVGIIDSGIDYKNAIFRNKDGTTRILYIYDLTETISPPSGFAKGHLYTADDINSALSSENPLSAVPSTDERGHGTAVSGIAAGNSETFTGCAPEASIVAVKLGKNSSRTVDIMRGLKFCTDVAESLGMPLSVNLSYGTNFGPHDGSSIFETYVDYTALAYKTAISVASGNEASSGHTYEGKLNTGESVDISLAVTNGIKKCAIDFWKNNADVFTFEVISPTGKSTGVFDSDTAIIEKNVDNTLVSDFIFKPTVFTQAEEIIIELDGNGGTVLSGIGVLRVTSVSSVDGRFYARLPLTDSVTEKTSFLNPSVENTVTSPGTAYRAITVGGIDAPEGSASVFSGRGNNYGLYGIKPDITAPAVNVTVPEPNGAISKRSGTSFASPFVCGAAALLLEWGVVRGNDPYMYGEKLKSFLIKGAVRSAQYTYPNSVFGYGILNMENVWNMLTGGTR